MIAFALIGVVSGFVASRFVYGPGVGLLFDIFVGIVGASIGWIFFGSSHAHPYSLWAADLSAVIGAVLLLALTHFFISSRRSSKYYD